MRGVGASGWLGISGLVFLVVCVVMTATYAWRNGVVDATETGCEGAFGEKMTPTDNEAKSDAKGILRVVGVWPTDTVLGNKVCVVVAGVASTAGETKLNAAVDAATRDLTTRQVAYDAATKALAAKQGERDALPSDTTPATAEKLKAIDAELTKLKTDADTKKTALDKAANDQLSALAAASAGSPPVPLQLFLNDLRAEHLKANARAVAQPQILYLTLEPQSDAALAPAEFWRKLLHSGTDLAQKEIFVGFSRGQTDMPDARSPDATTITILEWKTFLFGAVSLLCFLASFVAYALTSSLLRNNELNTTKADLVAAETAAKQDLAAAQALQVASETADQTQARIEPAIAKAAILSAAVKNFPDDPKKPDYVWRGSYSLAKTQMAFWLFLSVAGFVFIWLTTSQYLNLVTSGILVLLGITGTAGLAAIQLNDNNTFSTSYSAGFFSDLFSDDSGPQLYRIQVAAWTLLLGIIFVWNVIYNFTFVNFDTNLLILIGISQSIYVGFKAQENLAKK